MWATSGTFLGSLAFMLILSTSVTIVVLSTISPPSVLSLVMRKSARRLVKHVLNPREMPRQEELVVEAVAAVVDVEVELVAEANVLLGTMITRRKAPTLVL
jgi:ABC-type bacteriocin/lantibiotic exporter with double-glycine peptidase domain